MAVGNMAAAARSHPQGRRLIRRASPGSASGYGVGRPCPWGRAPALTGERCREGTAVSHTRRLCLPGVQRFSLQQTLPGASPRAKCSFRQRRQDALLLHRSVHTFQWFYSKIEGPLAREGGTGQSSPCRRGGERRSFIRFRRHLCFAGRARGQGSDSLLMNTDSSTSPGVGHVHFITPPSVCTAHRHDAETRRCRTAGVGAGCGCFQPLPGEKRMEIGGAERRLLLGLRETPFGSAKTPMIPRCLDCCLSIEGSCKHLHDTERD